MSPSQVSAPSFLEEPTYRYVTKAPPTVNLSIAHLLAYVPSNWIQEGHLQDHTMVELSCAEILQSHIPRISVEHLQKLIPQALHIPQEVDPRTKVLLPTTPVALAYHLITEREEGLLRSASATESSESVVTTKSAEKSKASSQGITGWLQKYFQKTPSPASIEEPEARPGPQFFASLPTFVPNPAPSQGAPSAPPTEITSSPVPEEAPPSPAASSLPVAAQPLPPIPEETKTEVSSHTAFKQLPLAAPLPTEINSSPVQEETPPPPASLSLPVPAQPLPLTPEETKTEVSSNALFDQQDLVTPLSHPKEPLSNQNELQALLLTTEARLSIHRVLDLCSQLPGIHTCLLVRGSQVVASSELPGKIHPIALSSQASHLLGNMRTVSTEMGFGTLSAITLFSSEGPISFLHERDLCFFILHKNKSSGFIPGVREKLQLILTELNKSKISLPPSHPTEP